jgi:hypothetical protein
VSAHASWKGGLIDGAKLVFLAKELGI